MNVDTARLSQSSASILEPLITDTFASQPGTIRFTRDAGGIVNGSTRFDYTNYFQALPSNGLERALFLEADRMRGLANAAVEGLHTRCSAAES